MGFGSLVHNKQFCTTIKESILNNYNINRKRLQIILATTTMTHHGYQCAKHQFFTKDNNKNIVEIVVSDKELLKRDDVAGISVKQLRFETLYLADKEKGESMSNIKSIEYITK